MRRAWWAVAAALVAAACAGAPVPSPRVALVAAAAARHPEKARRDPAAVGRDWRFMRAAAGASLAQIEAGKLASSRAGDPQVRALAKRLVREYTAANRRLRLLTLETQVPLPSRPTPAVRRQIQRLQQQRAAAFDATFLAQFGVAIERDTLSLFQEEASSSGGDVGLRQLAEETLPKLQESLRTAEELQAAHGR